MTTRLISKFFSTVSETVRKRSGCIRSIGGVKNLLRTAVATDNSRSVGTAATSGLLSIGICGLCGTGHLRVVGVHVRYSNFIEN
ncbi:hypothetical protein PUN28_011326 [Cardiocondyla obscurior]|uniref:Uncharacterized protein n=1 Tax=Cardiocondyla obscurior TaxID=286306 RepID=A0AAW2FFA0_9HYME